MSTLQIEEYDLPTATIGTKRKVCSINFGSNNSNLKAYIQAGLHADEAPGYLVATRLVELLKEADERGEILQRIVVVPVANPIGLSQWNTDTVEGRFDNSDNINFNRRYDDLAEEISIGVEGKLTTDSKTNIALIRRMACEILRNRQPKTETTYLKNLLQTFAHDADVVLDLHCEHEAVMHVYTGSTQWPEGADLSAQLGAKATLLAEDSGDTPFDESNSKLWWKLAQKFPGFPIPCGCFAATIELRGILDTEAKITDTDANNIYRFLLRRGYIAGKARELPPLLAEPTPLEGVDYVTADCSGVISFVKEPGEIVKEGDVIALVIDPMPGGTGMGAKSYIRSRTSGLFFARSVDRLSRPGKIIGKVAGKKALMKKGEYLLTF